ncbi:MAG: phosphoribosyl-AMP cyclohydrolase [Candidatus Nanopelagicales bacterium]
MMNFAELGDALPASDSPGLTPAGHAPDGRELITAVVQDAGDGQVLMLAWMDPDALAETLATGEATYYSRSRQARWRKGETSGHTQRVRELLVDCDGDAVLLRVEQRGAACHTGARSCFSTSLPLTRGRADA